MKTLTRIAIAAVSAAGWVLASASAAGAAPVTIAPIAVSEDLAEEIEETYGAREGEYLREMVTDALTQALAREGAVVAETAPLTVETTIITADPNKPTMKQLSDTPGLDYFYSLSIGGAELRGVLRRADGSVAAETHYRRYSTDLEDAFLAGGTWADARRAARTYARRMADAYVANIATGSASEH